LTWCRSVRATRTSCALRRLSAPSARLVEGQRAVARPRLFSVPNNEDSATLVVSVWRLRDIEGLASEGWVTSFTGKGLARSPPRPLTPPRQRLSMGDGDEADDAEHIQHEDHGGVQAHVQHLTLRPEDEAVEIDRREQDA